MLTNINNALLSKNITCEYQAVIQCGDRRSYYYEALARQRIGFEKSETLFNAIKWITNGKILGHLTQSIFWQTYKTFAHREEDFALNIPVHVFLDKYSYHSIESMIRNMDIGKRVIFEIVIEEWIEHLALISPLIQKLKEYGVRFAVDGFGSGKMMFHDLKLLHIDIIKVEGILFKSWIELQWGETVVGQIVEFARMHNMTTIAKEIDSPFAYQKAYQMGMDCMQGFYIHRPCEL
ncbi:EAL domain-containing protein [uncultured Sulfuricurvum sp.]|uniref:EAL domain-containing protein n=1 Tax=uncultured Sulfuricurvum sp. TaxID=430693 RepID=UPI0026130150|nr:EAL domain-containing protein [uncultured Sulfuricurvum sp.]